MVENWNQYLSLSSTATQYQEKQLGFAKIGG